MKRFYIFRDGTMRSRTATKDVAIDLIRQSQKLEMHPLLRSEFSIIAGEEEFISYPLYSKETNKAGLETGTITFRLHHCFF